MGLCRAPLWRRGGLLVLLCMLLVAGCASQPERSGVNREEAARLNAELGMRYLVQGRNERAMEKLKRALEYDPELVEAHHYLAELYRRLDQPRDADRHFREALKLAPEDSSLRNNYGVFLCGAGRVEEGEAAFLKVLENPVYAEPAQVYENLGLCMLEKPDYSAAEGYFRETLKRNARRPGALLGMVEIAHAKGEHLIARSYLQRYLRIARHTPESLWLALRVERALGNRDAVASYGMLLKERFPDADETHLYLESEWQ